MRLIDADGLMETVFNDTVLINGDVMQKRLVLAEAIETAPTVDAEPVRHGRWEYPDYYDYGDVCSYCGFDSGEIVGENQLKLLKYCPNCGAKMDEVSE